MHEATKKEDIRNTVEQHLVTTGLWEEAVSILGEGTPTPQQIEQAQAGMAVALGFTAEHTVGTTIFPGEGRQKSHTWKVVKAFQRRKRHARPWQS